MVSGNKKFFLVCVGSELLKGEVINSNIALLGKILFEKGFKLVGERSCPDDQESIYIALRDALKASDYVITTGGLGPTFDDITREVISKYFHCPLEFSKSYYQNLIRCTTKTGKLSDAVREGFRRQSFFPRGSKVISNRHGSASGFLIKSGDKCVIALPGVPREFEAMLSEEILPKILLKEHRSTESDFLSIRAIGINEVEFLRRLGSLPPPDSVQCGIYPDLGEVRFTALALNNSRTSKKYIFDLKRRLKKNLSENIYSFNQNKSFEEIIGGLLRARKKTVSVAESCTGGLVAKLLTAAPGSSDYFMGGVTAYSNRVKEIFVNVPKKKIQKFGAVSTQVAQELAKNIRKIMKTSLGIGITGIAGPRGGTRQKPVGLVYIGLADQNNVLVNKFLFNGDRERIRMLASKWALFLLWQKIKSGRF